MLIIGKDVEKSEPLYTAEGNVKWCCTLENSLAAPQKARYKLTVWQKYFTPSYTPKTNEDI